MNNRAGTKNRNRNCTTAALAARRSRSPGIRPLRLHRGRQLQRHHHRRLGLLHHDTQNTFQWYDGALQTNQVYIADTTHPATYNYNQYTYDDSNNLDNVQITDGHPRTVQFLTNAVGQILKRDENASGSSNTPHEMRYSFNNQIVGYVSNNGTSDTDYAAAITQHTTATSTGYYRNGSTSSVAYADFDQSYEPLNGNSVDSTSSSYTAMQGDTLQSIAATVWGDSSLWYLIADANGMTAGTALQAGQTLSIPNRVHNIHNNATTYKVYDPNSAIGDVAPSVPKAKHNNCGVFGQLILAVISIAIAVFLPVALPGIFGTFLGQVGAAVIGDVVSQGIGLATGIQKSFNWGEVAMAGIGAAVGGAIGEIGDITGVKVVDAVIRGALGSAITQGIGVATGLQKKFDWAGVAAAGIGAGVGELASQMLPGAAVTANVNGQEVQIQAATGMNRFVSGLANNIANAATRTLINGSDFGDNLIAALPSTVGSMIGEALADKYLSTSSSVDDGLNDSAKEAGNQAASLRENTSPAGLALENITPDRNAPVGSVAWYAYWGQVASPLDYTQDEPGSLEKFLKDNPKIGQLEDKNWDDSVSGAHFQEHGSIVLQNIKDPKQIATVVRQGVWIQATGEYSGVNLYYNPMDPKSILPGDPILPHPADWRVVYVSHTHPNYTSSTILGQVMTLIVGKNSSPQPTRADVSIMKSYYPGAWGVVYTRVGPYYFGRTY